MGTYEKLKEKYSKEKVPEHIGVNALSNAISPIGQNYLQTLFDPKEAEFKYKKHKVILGINRKEEHVILSFTESQRILLVGTSGSGKTVFSRGLLDRAYKSGILPIVLTDLKPEYHCLSADTEILTNHGIKLISNLPKNTQTKSWDFEKGRITDSKSYVIKSGVKEVFEIKLSDGRTVNATEDHKFFIEKDGKIVEKRLKEIQEGNMLVTIDGNV